jgi:Zn-dependent protease
MLVNGYFRVGRLAGADLRLHWSVPVGALVFGSLRFEPVLWLAFMAVVIVHELGHAVLVRSAGFRVIGIDLTGFGGHCRWRGSANALEHACIAWGGILAQTVLLMGTLAVIGVWGAAASRWGTLLQYAFVDINLWIIAMNLLPFQPLDGAKAWGVFGELKRAGWTPGRALIYPAWRWAQRRRQSRRGEHDSVTNDARPDPEQPVRRSVAAPGAEAPSDSVVSNHSAIDDAAMKPSAQAQRELAALLERIGDEAGKAKRRRD